MSSLLCKVLYDNTDCDVVFHMEASIADLETVCLDKVNSVFFSTVEMESFESVA